MPSTVKGPHVGYYDPGIAYMLYIEVGLVFMSIQCKCCKTYMQDIPAYMQHNCPPKFGIKQTMAGPTMEQSQPQYCITEIQWKTVLAPNLQCPQ